MEPSTPPRSRGAMFSTPRKPNNAEPVTPSTAKAFKTAPLLMPPPQQNRTFLKSPAYTPRRDSAKKRSLDTDTHVSRVLQFPRNGSLGEAIQCKGNLFESLSSATRFNQPLAKQTPGTPSDKVITSDLAEKWVQDHHASLSDDDDDALITKTAIKNPFVLSDTLTAEDYQNRHDQLLKEQPSLKDTLTFVNKKNQVVQKRYLTPEEQERFKPKRLFAEDLEKQ